MENEIVNSLEQFRELLDSRSDDRVTIRTVQCPVSEDAVEIHAQLSDGSNRLAPVSQRLPVPVSLIDTIERTIRVSLGVAR